MISQVPIIVFNGYFKGTKDKQAELSTYTTFTDCKTTASVIDNEDINFVYYNYKKPSTVRYIESSLSCKNMMKITDHKDDTVYVTVTCTRSGSDKKNYMYTYSVSLIIAYFEYKPITNYYQRIKRMCFNELISQYELLLPQIDKLKDKGFKVIEIEEAKQKEK
jgi:hypothetical protein